MLKFMFVLIMFFSFVLNVPSLWAGMAPENPVHEKLKAWEERHPEVYHGISTPEESKGKTPSTEGMKSPVARNGAVETDIEEKADDAVLAELMKEFDKNHDGIISYDEMDAAKVVGKDKELKALLEKKEARALKEKIKEKDEKNSSHVRAQKEDIGGPLQPKTLP